MHTQNRFLSSIFFSCNLFIIYTHLNIHFLLFQISIVFTFISLTFQYQNSHRFGMFYLCSKPNLIFYWLILGSFVPNSALYFIIFFKFRWRVSTGHWLVHRSSVMRLLVFLMSLRHNRQKLMHGLRKVIFFMFCIIIKTHAWSEICWIKFGVIWNSYEQLWVVMSNYESIIHCKIIM